LFTGFEIVTSGTLNFDTANSHTLSVSCMDGQNADVTDTHTVTLSDEVPYIIINLTLVKE